MNGAEYIVSFLKRKGIDVVFAYPGGNVAKLYEALSSSEINEVLVRHEQGAVHAAEGYAKMSGKVGVCLATSGPGATNLVTGLCDAMLDSVPLIAITGQVNSDIIGHDAFQEADILGVTIPVTKHNYLVKDKKFLPTILEEAFEVALDGRCGPVLIDITNEIFSEEIKETKVFPRAKRLRKNLFTLGEQQKRLLSLINNSSRPIMLCGGGAVNEQTFTFISNFCRDNHVPAVYTMMGKSSVDNNSPFVLGMVGVHGNECANSAIDDADLVIAIGTRFSDRTIPRPLEFTSNKTVIHVDVDIAEMSKNVFAKLKIVSDSSDFMHFLCSVVFSQNKKQAWKKWLEICTANNEASLCELSDAEKAVLIISNEAQKHSSFFVTDVGAHQLFAARECCVSKVRHFITSGGLGTMGFGLPALIGALYSTPFQTGILITGDGSFQMTFQELITLKGVPSNAKIFIFDNHSLGLMKNYESKKKSVYDIENPDFCMIAQAYGIKSERINSLTQLKNEISKILENTEKEIIHISL